MTVTGAEGGFGFISSGDPEPVKGVAKIESSEVLLASEAIEKTGDERKWITILDGDAIESAIVDAET